MAIAADPTGAAFGLWQAKSKIGAGIANVPGTPVWNETHDFEAAKAFYGRVFGYRFDDLSGDGLVYAGLNVGDRTVGGLGELPAEVPPHWSVHFGVIDTDAALARVEDLGGRRLSEPQDRTLSRMCDRGWALMAIAGAVMWLARVAPGARSPGMGLSRWFRWSLRLGPTLGFEGTSAGRSTMC